MSRNPLCPNCGEDNLQPTDSLEVASLLEGACLVDIRPPHERLLEPCPVECLTLEEAPTEPGEIPVILICRSGVRSFHLAQEFRDRGHNAVYSLRGGVLGLYRQH